ncbi:hypothetical protein Misp01_03370 [Microtetraspora sp. NBRC 13810]|nr:hypothetical protein Misp01_03370 [Microtetraspora sp. NBRC 13810]
MTPAWAVAPGSAVKGRPEVSHQGSATVYPGWVSLGTGAAQAAAVADGAQTTDTAAASKAETPIRSDLMRLLHQKINLLRWMYHAMTITPSPIPGIRPPRTTEVPYV